MAKILQIVHSKPNPSGKDRMPSGQAKPVQLLGEWVDIKNIGEEAISFSCMRVSHTTFNPLCQPTGSTEEYWQGAGSDSLKPGQILRVHTGRHQDEMLMLPLDKAGADWHGYANRNSFVLNNRCGDTIQVAWLNSSGRTQQDSASYAPNPPEGVILKRVGSQLR